MEIVQISENKKRFLDLLLAADEQEDMIDRYLDIGDMYVLYDGGAVAECVVTDEGKKVLEIKNIAVKESHRRKGYGRALINFIVQKYSGRYSVLQVGTGDSPLTVPFYEKCGFVRTHSVKNFFTDNYDHPIYECGVPLTDMIYFQRRLQPSNVKKRRNENRIGTLFKANLVKKQRRVACKKNRDALYWIHHNYGGSIMEMREILKKLRENNNLTQEQMAERVMVTRQAVSRWETGETQPNTDTLKLLSREFNISINTLLGSPRQLVCQCCGMPLTDDGLISRENDGSYNEDYCKWCYSEGNFVYESKDSLLDFLVSNMPNPENLSDDERRTQFDSYLSQLKHWKQ